MSNPTDVEARTPASSSREKVDTPQSTNAATDRCSIITPFGLPVEPEVYMTYARSFRAGAGHEPTSSSGLSESANASSGVITSSWEASCSCLQEAVVIRTEASASRSM